MREGEYKGHEANCSVLGSFLDHCGVIVRKESLRATKRG